MKRLLFALLITAAIVFGIWLIVIPSSLIIHQIENSLHRNDLQGEITGLKKGLFFSFTSQNIILKKHDNTLLSLDNVVGKMNPLSLFMMRLTLTFHGDISGGKITGNVTLLKGKNHLNVSIDNATIDGIPLFNVMGLSGKGTLSGEFRLRDGTGDLKFSIKDAQFENTSFSGVIIPVNLFQSATGAMTIDGDLVRISSLSLQGDDFYARVKGNIKKNVMDLTLELMQNSSSTDKASLLFLLENYKVSPGYYVIPVKGSIPF